MERIKDDNRPERENLKEHTEWVQSCTQCLRAGSYLQEILISN